jgi:hypothetical protein
MLRSILTVHSTENFGRTRLNGQVEMLYHLGFGSNYL